MDWEEEEEEVDCRTRIELRSSSVVVVVVVSNRAEGRGGRVGVGERDSGGFGDKLPVSGLGPLFRVKAEEEEAEADAEEDNSAR
jgi:hypothetical protein